jgi:2,3-dihydroxybenzoate-AMP ligase
MLDGFVPFPDDYARRYRDRGYWLDRSLAQEFADVFARFADRTALIDGERRYTYAELDRLTDNLALNLLELGLRPLDRVVPVLPNVAEFVILYFALQKIGAIPIAALVTHRYAEISQFTQLSGARGCVYPESSGDFRFAPMIERVQNEYPSMQLRIVLGQPAGQCAARAGHRAGRSVHISVVRWHHRYPQADSAYQQRLRVQLENCSRGRWRRW